MAEQETDEVNKKPKGGNAEYPTKTAVPPDQEIKPKPPDGGQGDEVSRLEQQMGRSERGMLRSTVVTAVFTGVLTLLAFIQAYSFIESERAFLILEDLRFLHVEPTSEPDGYDLILKVKNVGKHTAIVSEFDLRPGFFVIHKTLPDVPPYDGAKIDTLIPPVGPDEIKTINAHAIVKPSKNISDADRLAGVLSGDVPLRVFGFIEYDIGYPSFRSGKLGFCQEYVPISRRKNGPPFETCNHPAYTYTR